MNGIKVTKTNIFLSIPFFVLLLVTANPASSAPSSSGTKLLPVNIQVDLLVEDLRAKREAKDHGGVIEVISKIRSLDTEFPDFLLWVEAQSLNATGDVLAARDRLLAYLNNEGTQGRFYEQAKGMLVAIAPQAEELERTMQEERKKRVQENAAAEKKAVRLRTQETQRFLDQLGFKVEITGKLNKQTQEAVAVYQIRRDLQINGQITDEVIDLLRTEVPDHHLCDSLAHYSRSADDWSTIPIEKIDSVLAVSECNNALRLYPHVVRFQIQYARGLTAAKRAADAAMLVTELVHKEYPAAEFLLGYLYASGSLQDSGRPDYENAMRMFNLAAKRGYARGQYHIGSMYSTGTGISRNQNIALDWYKQAGAQGYVPAQMAAARLFETGRGTNRSYQDALQWYGRAADLHHAAGQFKVAEFYERGRSVKKDKATALAWYKKAAEQGYSGAAEKVRRLSR